MAHDRDFGSPDGLTDRLLNWIERLSMDKSLPWVGLGLIDDLQAAADELSPGTAAPDPRQPTLEFDL